MKTNRFFLLAVSLLFATVFSFSQEPENEIRFGGRVANGFNSLGSESFAFYGSGLSFAVGAVASIPIINTVTFNPELNLIYRGFNMLRDATMEEFAISIPALFQYMSFGGPIFYLETGIQLDIPFARKEFQSEDYYYKDVFLGIPFGLGWHIGKHFVIDYRVIIDLLAYSGDGDISLSLFQSELSLLYLF